MSTKTISADTNGTTKQTEVKTAKTAAKEAKEGEQQTNVIAVPVSIPDKDGAVTKAIFSLDLSHLGRSVAEMLKQFPTNFTIRLFRADIEIKRSNDFTARTFKAWKEIVSSMFKGMDNNQHTTDEAKLAFLKAMPFKASEPCFAAYMQAVKIKEDNAKAVKGVIMRETNALNVSTIESTKLLKKRIERAEIAYKAQADKFLTAASEAAETVES